MKTELEPNENEVLNKTDVSKSALDLSLEKYIFTDLYCPFFNDLRRNDLFNYSQTPYYAVFNSEFGNYILRGEVVNSKENQTQLFNIKIITKKGLLVYFNENDIIKYNKLKLKNMINFLSTSFV